MQRRSFMTGAVGALALVSRLAIARSDAQAGGRFAAAIEKLAGKLAHDYVIPPTGARYAAMLRTNLARGDYADIDDAARLAARLTTELRAMAPDGHLRVVTGDEAGRRPRRAAAPLPQIRMLSGAVAYIRFYEFSGSPQSLAAVEGLMRGHAGARVLIIDARTLPGGGMDEMNVLFPYLYARETTLVAMDIAQRFVDEHGPPPDSGEQMRIVSAPAGIFRREHFVVPHVTEHRWFDTPVFCLTSDRTASAGEHLVLALQRTQRATVIGGRTAGGNHFGDFEDLGAGLSAFIPVGRTIDPDTGEDWEGRGIVPDVEVGADAALAEALRRSAV